jgi:hypothetical protein
MVLKANEERAYIFDHAWRQVSKKFYDPKIHGIDWKGYHDNYAKFLPHINNNYDFQELLSEFLGELMLRILVEDMLRRKSTPMQPPALECCTTKPLQVLALK